MRIIYKPVALAWRQRASAALRARAAATLPSAFVNNSHDFGTYKSMKTEGLWGGRKTNLLHPKVEREITLLSHLRQPLFYVLHG
jgi:hypothetical protein